MDGTTLIKKDKYYIVFKDDNIITHGLADCDFFISTKNNVFVTTQEYEYNEKLSILKIDDNEIG